MAYAFAMGMASDYVRDLYDKLIVELEKKDFKLLDVLHHYTSGMKSIFT